MRRIVASRQPQRRDELPKISPQGTTTGAAAANMRHNGPEVTQLTLLGTMQHLEEGPYVPLPANRPCGSLEGPEPCAERAAAGFAEVMGGQGLRVLGLRL